ncbi:LOW QUALITY PROTEIN: WD repeat-containing protein 6 [Tachyglossus aculeatus]|uniref:LOW QUALITY PROTEIN: WD repeat-containing protein 6 n=1 Tax=Tachyglossus aculeatus TaxID=9261 RepID=UPI0018F3544B|nr:LOW QUALITY PROTEIN: WD repeat-containing protein 6 [Tachyglossus aculeatus]
MEGAGDVTPALLGLESVLLLAPVTALECVGGYLLAGEGPNLTVYSLKSEEALGAVQCVQNVLRHHRVHGLKERGAPGSGRPSGTTLAVFGGKGLRVLKLNDGQDRASLTPLSRLCELHDWIWDVRWLRDAVGRSACLALALAHNSVLLYDAVTQEALQEVHCEEKCILYSAHLVGSDWQELALVAGTVFNQLVVWRVADPAGEGARIQPRWRIGGHSGVIFSICYSEKKGILASASDDRSVRVWSVGDLRTLRGAVRCVLVCYGHQSRVWAVRLLGEYIISVGEDSACIVWGYDGERVQSFKGHKGRSIRAVAVHEAQKWVITGGADAGIRLWSLPGPGPRGDGLLPLNLASFTPGGTPKAVSLVGPERLLAMTDGGAVYLYDLEVSRWKFLLEDSSYRSYSLLEAARLAGASGLGAIGNLEGRVKIFSLHRPEEARDVKWFEGKVHSLSWVSPPGPDPPNGSLCRALFASGPGGVLVWLDVSCDPLGHIGSVVERRRYLLPPCKQRWHTCVAFLPREDFVVCGDRRGSLLLFSRGPSPESTEEGRLTGGERESEADSEEDEGVAASGWSPAPSEGGPVSLLFGLHGKQGVTSVTCRGGFIYSTGRDGLLRQLCVRGNRLRVLRKQKPCKGMDWVARLCFAPDESLLVLGFRSTDFVIWSMRTHEKLCSVPCGGGHRSWSFAGDPSSGVFAFVKAGDVAVHRHRAGGRGGGARAVLKESLHGRELTSVRYVGTVRTPAGEPVAVLVTGSEDTTVNVLAVRAAAAVTLATVSVHISSVRALAVAGAEADRGEGRAAGLSAVLFSAGGRAEIECHRLTVHCDRGADGGAVRCQVIHVASHQLAEHWDHVKNKHKLIKMDPETRYMSVAVLADAALGQPGPRLILAAACSDGSVRLFLMWESAPKLLLLAESFHHQRCVLKVQLFTHQGDDGERRVLLCSAATDGSISFWDVTAALDQETETRGSPVGKRSPRDLAPPRLTIRAQSGGINSLHVRPEAGRYLVASGSDDGSILVCVIAVEVSPGTPPRPGGSRPPQPLRRVHVRVVQKLLVLSAHAAQVTGLRVLRPDLVVSASIDQRLTFWRLSKGGLEFLGSRTCHVADASELDCWWSEEEESYHCVISGQGLEIVRCRI